MTAPSMIVDVGDAEFEQAVLARSHEVPVVVDFWAPWCGPCRALGPVLERVAEELAGGFLLVKVNVDEAQQVASRFAVKSIPMVIGFRDGEPVAHFVGAKPEGEVRRFVASLIPSEAERLARAGDRVAAEDAAAAEAQYRAALAEDPHCGAARLGLARIHGEQGEIDAALALLDGLMGSPVQEKEADQLSARLRTIAGGDADEALLRAAASADPTSPAAHLALGRLLAATQRYEEALGALIRSVRCEADHQDGAARKAVVDVFEILGSDDPLTQRFRRELAAALYR